MRWVSSSNFFAQAQIFWRGFDVFVRADVLEGTLEGHLQRRGELDAFAFALGTHVGEAFGFAGIDWNVVFAGVFADDLALVDFVAGLNHEAAAFLHHVEGVSGGFAGIHADERTVLARGNVAAIRAAQLGLKTAIVERELLGGICLNWGCIPTKALLRSGEMLHHMRHADSFGLVAGDVKPDLTKIVARSRAVAKQLNQGVTHLMKKNKIAVHMGEGTISAPGKMTVTADGKKTELAAKHIIIATGARARELPFAQSDGKRIWTYRHAMTPPEMPTELLVIGSGAIGIEFASFYNDMGAKVTVVEMLDRVVPVEDAEVSDFLPRASPSRA